MCYVRSSIPHRIRSDIARNANGVESMVIEVKMKCDKCIFIFVYKPPNVACNIFKEALEIMIEQCLT